MSVGLGNESGDLVVGGLRLMLRIGCMEAIPLIHFFCAFHLYKNLVIGTGCMGKGNVGFVT